MQKIKFSNGDEMAALGLGTWLAPGGEVGKAVEEAIDIGYRHLDGAHIYGNEKEIGEALTRKFKAGSVDREAMWITSKLWSDAHAPEDVEPAVKETLQDLQLEYLDLYLIHWPVALKRGVTIHKSPSDLVPLEELPLTATWAAMESLVDKGLCRHIGVSNFSVAKLQQLADSARICPEMNQIELHPYLQQPEMLEYCGKHQIHLTAYSPLGSPGRPVRMKSDDEPAPLQDPKIVEIAKSHGVTAAQVLIRWAIQRGTAVIPKTVHSERLRENFAAGEIELTDDDMKTIASLDRHARIGTGEFWVVEGGPYTLANLWDE